MTIRKATPVDLDFISRVETICWGDQGASKNDFSELLESGSSFISLEVLELDGELKGFVGYSFVDKENYLDIWNLAISPEFRQLGFGLELIRSIQNYAQSLNTDFITLKVSEQNTGALRLYKRLGFEVIRKLENYYSEGDSGLVLKFNSKKPRKLAPSPL